MELPEFEAVLESDDQVTDLIKKMDVYRKQLDFPTDGLVFKLNSLAKQRELGEGTSLTELGHGLQVPARAPTDQAHRDHGHRRENWKINSER
jgi:hypothetical protein